jgi:hypothetical protein
MADGLWVGSISADWGDVDNWVDPWFGTPIAMPPGNGETAFFAGPGGNPCTVGSLAVGALVMNHDGSPYGGTLTVLGGETLDIEANAYLAGTIDIESGANLAVSTDIELDGQVTFSGTGTLTNDGVGAGTLTCNGASLPAFVAANNDGLTAQDAIAAKSFTVNAAAVYDDGGFAHTIGGSIVIDPDSSPTLTGAWRMTADGDLANNNSGATEGKAWVLTIDEGVTATGTNSIYLGGLVLNGTITGVVLVYPSTAAKLAFGANSLLESFCYVLPTASITMTTGIILGSNSTLEIGATGTLKLGGDIVGAVGRSIKFRGGNTVDMNGHRITGEGVGPNIVMGSTTGCTLLLRGAIHTFNSLAFGAGTNTVNFGSCYIALGGTLDATNITALVSTAAHVHGGTISDTDGLLTGRITTDGTADGGLNDAGVTFNDEVPGAMAARFAGPLGSGLRGAA